MILFTPKYLSKIACLILFALAMACQSGKRNGHAEANAVHDLLLDRVFWKPLAVTGHRDTLINEHRFTITNTSSKHSYSQIQVRFDYYDSLYHRIDSAKYTVSQPIEPRSAITLNNIKMGKTNPATKSSAMVVQRAMAD